MIIDCTLILSALIWKAPWVKLTGWQLSTPPLWIFLVRHPKFLILALVALIQLYFTDSHCSEAQINFIRNIFYHVNHSSMCCGLILQDIKYAFRYCNKRTHDIDILMTFCYLLGTKTIIIKASLDPLNVINRFNLNKFLLIVTSLVILRFEHQCQ